MDTTTKIRELNDALRQRMTDVFASSNSGNWRVMLTPGIQALGPIGVGHALRQVRDYTAFTDDNDPHGEHDFGVLEIAGERLFFKIDYYDPGMSGLSADPADPAVTRRVLTLLLASEY